jgi:hypothetical protein
MDDTYDFSDAVPVKTDKTAPILDEPETYDGGSVLDRLRTELSRKVERPTMQLEVPERPGVTVQISPNITQHQLRAWRKNSGENTKPGFDPTKFACYVIGHTTTGIFMDGQEVLSEAGNSLSFASPEILEMTDTTRPLPDCILAFFGLDPHVEAAALAIMEAAGYGDEVETVDPTTGS